MILVCGEALIDLFVGDGMERTLPARAVPGGSPFNVAIGLARLGAPAGFLGGLSTDRFGRLLADVLAGEGVETRFIRRSPKPTPLAVVANDAAGNPQYGFHIHDCAERDLGEGDLPALAGVQALALGSFSLATEPIGSALLSLARRAGDIPVSLDPNLRPSVVGDLDRWRRRFEQFLGTAAIVKLSHEDLALAYGGARPDDIATHWLAAGARLVAITDGAAGATAYHASGRIRRPGRPIMLRDAVGAGDTFHAALLARLAARGRLDRAALAGLDDAAIVDLLDYAIAAATITCTREGADLPRAGEVAALFGEGA